LGALPGPKGWRGFCVPTHWALLQKPCQRAIPGDAPLLVNMLRSMIWGNCVSNFYFTVLGVAGFPRSGGSGKPQVWSAGEASPVLILNNTWKNGRCRIILYYQSLGVVGE